MSYQEQPFFHPRYLSIEETWEIYEQKDQPLNEATIRAILEPLAGTSFLKRATDILQWTQPGKPIRAIDLYLIFYGFYHDTVPCQEKQLQEDAATTLYALSGFSVPLDAISIQWMEPDELLAREIRADFLFHDPQHARYAGTHFVTRFDFYKAGRQCQTLCVSQIEYNEISTLKFHEFTQFAEGTLPHRFFSDVNRCPLPFLDPRQFEFHRTEPLLCIGPQFSVEAARPRPHP